VQGEYCAECIEELKPGVMQVSKSTHVFRVANPYPVMSLPKIDQSRRLRNTTGTSIQPAIFEPFQAASSLPLNKK
jgi:hypothetical protein